MSEELERWFNAARLQLRLSISQKAVELEDEIGKELESFRRSLGQRFRWLRIN